MTDDLHSRLAALEEENERLRERNEYVEEMYVGTCFSEGCATDLGERGRAERAHAGGQGDVELKHCECYETDGEHVCSKQKGHAGRHVCEEEWLTHSGNSRACSHAWLTIANPETGKLLRVNMDDLPL